MSVRAKAPPDPPDVAGLASRLNHVLSVGLSNTLSIGVKPHKNEPLFENMEDQFLLRRLDSIYSKLAPMLSILHKGGSVDFGRDRYDDLNRQVIKAIKRWRENRP